METHDKIKNKYVSYNSNSRSNRSSYDYNGSTFNRNGSKTWNFRSTFPGTSAHSYHSLPPPVVGTQFTLAGLGQGTGTASLLCEASFETQCTNPGGKVAPGQDATTSVESPDQAITPNGGKATVQAINIPVDQPTQADFGCPNNSWTGSVVGQPTVTATLNVDFNGITLAGFPISDDFP